MKRNKLLQHLRMYGCILKREGSAHSLYINRSNGSIETVPRHSDIDEMLARKICKGLGIPTPKIN
ncbi:MAG: addiction module toxin, HicA family [Spirochaetes bacterium GWF1_51_8]|nr:MAG: addiction module toxin, HicA family [Spirochaetes bacterium GWF1_51_8]